MAASDQAQETENQFKTVQFKILAMGEKSVLGSTKCLGVAFTGEGSGDHVTEIPHDNIVTIYADCVDSNGDG